MKNPLILSLIALALLATISHAQNVPEQKSAPYRFSIGVTPGLSLSLQPTDPRPGDPLHILDHTAPHACMTFIVTYRIASSLGLEFAVSARINPAEQEGIGNQKALFEEMYPGYLAASHGFSESAFAFTGGGISYRMQFGDFTIEPALLACYAGIGPGDFYLLMKKQGENQYLAVRHHTGKASTFTLVPATSFRYTFESEGSRVGLLFRTSFINAGFNVEQSITVTSLSDNQVSYQTSEQHTFSLLNLELGAYLLF